MCRGITRCTIKKEGRNTGDTLVLVTKTLAIRNELYHVIQDKYTKDLLESDSLVVI